MNLALQVYCVKKKAIILSNRSIFLTIPLSVLCSLPLI